MIDLENDSRVACLDILFRSKDEEYVIPPAVDASSMPVVCT